MKSPLIWSLGIALILAGLVFAVLFDPASESDPRSAGELSDSANSKGSILGGILESESANGAAGAKGDGNGAGPPPAPTSQEAQSAEVNLVAVRKALPKNLYWELAAPTEDEAELKRREERDSKLNEQFGRVQANLATAAEIRDYYAFQKRRSEDFIQFLKYVMAKHGDELSMRDEGLYGLGIELHTARLKEIPRALDEALRRKVEHDRKRQDWLAGQN
ncbi:MAG: hypothetical protein RIF32_09785 [Leptospirales bacterium]